MKKNSFIFLILLLSLAFSAVTVFAQSDSSSIITNGDGTFSMQNGIYLRSYENYSKDSQVYLSALDACYSIIADYSPVIDPYVKGEKAFTDEQWNTIISEIKYTSGKACSYVMSNDVPDDLSEHSFEIFYSAYHLMIANDLLLDALQSGDSNEASIASYYYTLADQTMQWWEK